jgi:Carbohydrate family 9 binding domain-like
VAFWRDLEFQLSCGMHQYERSTVRVGTGRGSQPHPFYFRSWVTILLLSFLAVPNMTAQKMPEVMRDVVEGEIVAKYVDAVRLDAAHPDDAWQNAIPIAFASDWQGKNADPARETQVRVLWSRQYLYLRFECRYRELFVFEDSDPNGRRDHLWDRDVAEAFLQPDPSRERFYKEFEVSPNGMWVDLDIFPGGLAGLKSGLQRSVVVDNKSRTWTAELAIPIKSLTTNFDPKAIWRANFYRVEGAKEPRAYLAWQATYTPQPNFHVSSAFGRLRFAGAPAN